ncbi:sensor histidine kinase [Holdemania filiformis]|uniref:histidine kinase n=1 Tax=Holdemania filiformis DSM 12042 TaxID=545696 RepID=B9YDA3_9FIRM|nr:HAMP domain-containing sensor histidine kinase [Holdemania filiformis]EEF66046.1 ATPase/histidine kinase/DNA gyrase B/HSP90 domain protein [Holdemania filiformis DSM 12042]
MFKRFRVLLLFFALLLLPLGLFLHINHNTAALMEHDEIPASIENRPMRLVSGMSADQQRCSITLKASAEVQPLTLILDNAGPVQVWVNDQQVYLSSSQDPYQRIQFVTLPQAEGTLTLSLAPSELQRNDAVSTSQPYSPPGMLLAGPQAALSASHVAFGITMFYAGFYLLLMMSSLTLFQKKKEETYLLLLAAASLVSLLRVLVLSAFPLFPLSYAQCSLIMPGIFLMTTLCQLLIIMMLLKPAIPVRLQAVFTPRILTAGFALLMLLQYITPEGVETLIRILAVIPILILFVRADQRHLPGTFPLVCGYAVWESILLFYYLIYNRGAMQAGELMIVYMLPQFGFLFFMMMAALVINRKFAAKFDESESLNRELEQMNANLDHLVDERTQQLQKEQAQKQRMIMKVLHDVRSPIFVLKGCLQQLEAKDEGQQRNLSTMRQRLEVLEGLSDDLFLSVKLENHELAFVFDEVCLNDLLTHLAEAHQVSARQKQIRINLILPKQAIWVWADDLRLQRVFDNLLRNALAHTPEGGQIDCVCSIKGEQIEIRIQDTGEGIDPEELPQLFDAFYTGNQSQGSGLGLAIAREIVEAHRGTIEVEATSKEGTVFLVRLKMLNSTSDSVPDLNQ